MVCNLRDVEGHKKISPLPCPLMLISCMQIELMSLVSQRFSYCIYRELCVCVSTLLKHK